MNLLNEKVHHKMFKGGMIIAFTESHITVKFGDAEKKFVFPDAFEEFLQIENEELAEKIKTVIRNKKAEKLKLQKEKIDFPKATLKSTTNRPKKIARANIAFKCNYCDGGKSQKQVGYCGVCSDGAIENNVAVEHRTWCTSDTSACLKYYNGEISRNELDAMCANGGFVCYESQMLRDWKALAGIVQHGENKGKPMKLNRVQTNSLCVLTTRNPNSSEDKRYIFAAFLVDETYDGDEVDEGYVATTSKYKIKLSPEEGHKLLFWNYHSNTNQPEVPAWNSGLHRYFDDIQAVQILRDIVLTKAGTPDEPLAKEFLDYFCKVNNIDVKYMALTQGALKRK